MAGESGGNGFEILLAARIDETVSIGNINDQIERIAEKINALRVRIQIDPTSMNDLSGKVASEMSKAAQNVDKAQQTIQNSTNKTTQSVKQEAGAVQDLNQQMGQYGKLVAEQHKYSVKDNKYLGGLRKFREGDNESGFVDTTVKLNGNGESTVQVITSNYQKDQDKLRKVKEKAARERVRLENQIAADIEKALDKAIKGEVDKVNEQTRQVNAAIQQQQGMYSKKDAAVRKSRESSIAQQIKDDEEDVKKMRREALRIEKLGDRQAYVKTFDQKGAESAIKSTFSPLGDVEIKNLQQFWQDDKKLYRFTAAVKTGKDTFKEYKGAIDESTMALYQNGEGTQKTLNRNQNFFEQLKIAVSRVPMWMIAMTLFYGTLRAVQQGIKDVIAVDSAMVDLRKVTDESKQSYKEFALEANSMGLALGKSSVDVIKSTAEFARLGYSLDQAKMLSKNALLFSNVGDIDVKTASQDLVSTVKGFGIEIDREGKNITKIVDVYNEVGNNFAITSAGIGAAMSRSASSLHEAGNTVEESVAMITAANAVVQDPESVGTALKTIAMRLRGMGEEGEIVKELVPKLEGAFNKLGLTIKKDANTFKSTFEIMQDLSKVWGNLDDMTKADVLEKVAGKRQGNIVAGMLGNWKDAEKALKSGQNSFGSAATENAKALDSVEAKMAQFSNAVVGFWQTLINSEGIKGFFGTLVSLAQAVTKFVNAFGIMIPVVAAVSIALLVFSKGTLQSLNGSLISSFVNLTGVGKGFIDVATKAEIATFSVNSTGATMGFAGLMAKGFALSMNGLKTAALGVIAVLPQMLILTAVGYAISFAYEKITQLREEQKKLQEELTKTTTSYNEHRNEIDALVKRYDELSSRKPNLSIEEHKELVTVQDKLAKLLPTVATGFDAEGHAILKTADAVNALSDSLKELTKAQNAKDLANISDNFKTADEALKKAEQRLKDAEAESVMHSSSYSDPGTGGLITIKKTAKDEAEDQLRIAIAKKDLKDAQEALNKVYGKHNDLLNFGKDAMNLVTDADKKYLDGVKKKLEADKENNKNGTNYLVISDKVAKQEAAIAVARDKLAKPIAYDQGDTAEKRAALITKQLLAQGVAQEFINVLLAEYNAKVNAVSSSAQVFANIHNEMHTATNTFVGDQKELAQTLDDINTGQRVSTDTILKLIDKYPELNKAMYVEQGILKLNGQLVKELADAKQLEHKQEMVMAKQKAEAEKVKLEASAQRIFAELKMQGTLNDLKQQEIESDLMIYRMESQMSMRDDPNYAASIDRYVVQLENLKKIKGEYALAVGEIAKITAEADILANVDWNKMLGRDDDKKKSDSTTPPEPLVLSDYEWKDQQQQAIIEKAKARMETMDKLSKEYAAEQMKIVDAFKERQRLAAQEAPRIRQDAASLLPRIDAETDIAKRNELIRKYQEWMKKAESLGKEWWAWQKEMNDLTIIPDSEKFKVDEFAAAVEQADNKIKEHQAAREDLKKSSQEYRIAVVKEIDAINNKQAVYQKEIDRVAALVQKTKEQAEQDGLTAKQKNELIKLADEYEKKLRELVGTQSDLKKETKSLNNELKDSRKAWEDEANGVADKVIEAIKEYYKRKKELALDAIEKESKAEEKRHNKKMGELDEEYKAEEKATNAKLKAIDEEAAKDDFNKALSKEQKERADLQTKINQLSMDNSMEAQAKLAELKKQLADKDEKINDMKTKRERDLRKQNLQETLNDKKEEVDKKKKAEDDFHNTEKQRLDDAKQYWSDYYDDQINNEKKWADIRKAILEGNISELKTQLGGYIDEFDKLVKESMEKTGTSINKNISLLEQLKKASQDVGKIPYNDKPANNAPTGPDTKTGDGNSGNEGDRGKQKALDNYIQNKVEWWKDYYKTGGETNTFRQKQLADNNRVLRDKYGFTDYTKDELVAMGAPGLEQFVQDFREYVKNKISWEGANDETKKKLGDRNTKLRSQYNFPDWSTGDIQRLGLDRFNTGGYTGDWAGSDPRFALVDQKEIILKEDDTARLLKAVQLATQPMPLPTITSQSSSGKGTTIIQKIEMIIENLTGDVNGGKTAFSVLVSELKKRGVNQ